MLGTLMDSLDYVGVMAMECFRVGNDLMVNEVAPRVHNSGHWSLTGSEISQFEYHLRAVANLPTPAAVTIGPSAMVNLIGTDYVEAWRSVPEQTSTGTTKRFEQAEKLVISTFAILIQSNWKLR